MTTLDDLLALLPDNETGDISAEDMRQVVTALWTETQKVRSAFSYLWEATSVAPGNGHLAFNNGWSLGSTIMFISKQTKDGEILPSSEALPFGARYVILGIGSNRLEGIVLGDPVDAGSWYEVAIENTVADGSATDNDPIRVVFTWTAA